MKDVQLKFKDILQLVTSQELETIFDTNPMIRRLYNQCLALRGQQTLNIPLFPNYKDNWKALISSWWLYPLLCLTPVVPEKYYCLEISRDAYLTMFRIYNTIFHGDYLLAEHTKFTPPIYIFAVVLQCRCAMLH